MLVVTIIWLLILGSVWTAFVSLAGILMRNRLADAFKTRSDAALVFCSSVSLLAVCFGLLGLFDIRQDYAGYRLKLADGTPVQSLLPEWARCDLEWSIVMPAMLAIAVSQMFMVGMLIWRQRADRDAQSAMV